MSDDSFRDEFEKIIGQMRQIMMTKRAQRGTSNISNQGLGGVVARMAEDKLSRIKKSAEGQRAAQVVMAQLGHLPAELKELAEIDKSGMEDDLLDVANYAIIALCLLRGKWE